MADPGALAKSLIQKNFSKFGTIRKLITFKVMGDPTEVNRVITDVVIASHSLYAIWDEFSFTANMAATHKFDDSTILSIDKKLIFPALDLPVIPSQQDRIVDDSNVEWSIRGISVDPAEAHYELHVRPLK